MNRCLRKILLGLFCLLALSGLTASELRAEDAAEGPAGGEEATTEAPAEADLIAVPRIPEKAEALSQTLRGYTETSHAAAAIAAIEKSLGPLQLEIEKRAIATNEALEVGASIDQLRDFEAEWSQQIEALGDQRKTLTRRASSLEQNVEQLMEERALWKRTLAHARETESPPLILDTIDGSLVSIDEVIEQLRDRRAHVLTLLTRVTAEEQRALRISSRIAENRDAIRASLFEPNAPPLTEAFQSSGPLIPAGEISETIKTDWRALQEFADSRKQQWLPPLLVFLTMLFIGFVVRNQIRELRKGESLVGPVSVFDRPVSVAIVSTALFAASYFPFAPHLAWDFVGIVLVFPLLRLLTPIVPTSSRGILALLAIFYLTDRARDLLESAATVERYIFFFETVAAAFVLSAFLRPERLEKLPQDGVPPHLLGTGLRFAMGAFILSALANLFGFAAFAKILGEGTLNAIYSGMLAYAVYRIGWSLCLVLLSSETAQRIASIRTHRESLSKWAGRFLGAGALVAWFSSFLEGFLIRDLLSAGFMDFLSAPIEVGTISISLGNILAFPVTIMIAVLISRALRSVLEQDLYPRVALQRGVGNAVSTSLHYLLLVGGFLIALGAAGIDLSKFSLLAGALGVGVGFGLQTVVNNFVSGLILLFERPVQAGDMIEVGGLIGEVKKIGIRASTIVTFQGAEVIIPNGTLLSEQLTNWTLSNRNRRVDLPVGVAYGNNPETVQGILMQVLQDDDGALSFPAPVVLFRGFGDSSLDFELRFWVSDFLNHPIITSNIAGRVYDALEQAGIEVPFPQRDLHLRSIDAGAASAIGAGSGSASASAITAPTTTTSPSPPTRPEDDA